MNYSNVFIDAIGYDLPPVVVRSEDLEEQLRPLYQKLRMPAGQLASMTGIRERRWWEEGFHLADGAINAGWRALEQSSVRSEDLDVLIYAGVCREQFEPATACRVAAALQVPEHAAVFDISNACLGVLNGMVDIANRIELGQIRAGLVVAAETAREIVQLIIQRLLDNPTMEMFRTSVATLTGGSGAVAVLLTDGTFGSTRRKLLGGVTRTAPQFHDLCRWGVENIPGGQIVEFMKTDSVGVLKHGVALGLRTWHAFLAKLGWVKEQVDRIICHQVGAPHRDTILQMLELPQERDFPTFPFLGNIGTVSLPLTAALAEERGILQPGDRVGFLGIGSGLNCLMLGIEW